jgi:hypothetical protein
VGANVSLRIRPALWSHSIEGAIASIFFLRIKTGLCQLDRLWAVYNVFTFPARKRATRALYDRLRDGGREEQCIPHVGGSAGATHGVFGHLRSLGMALPRE